MELSPEERQRIYAEEKTRVDAQEQVRKELEQKRSAEKWGLIKGLGIAVAGCLAVVLFYQWMLHSKSLAATVEFTGTQFQISNLDGMNAWDKVKMTLNGGLLGGGYTFQMSHLGAFSSCMVGGMQFTKSDGTRFNPLDTKPVSFHISARVGPGMAYWSRRW